MTLLRRPTEGKSKHGFIWVKVSAAIALGLGTMIGWKRIVVTVGERIGKHYLAYAQGASAEMVAAGTILGAEAAGFLRPIFFRAEWRARWRLMARDFTGAPFGP